ncbi:hypothetical protein K488DRAFT_74180 [Vararia minispora EC-137]|uniref:Uncharacterized protein n=1 Tax=Vararia minispora EC-137 TaxID=1314806 RepID=A0ACB8Q800_9AGAM|nr:hypothetical protein K488DRAFT_74180 [Vararia minispora EC-137]
MHSKSLAAILWVHFSPVGVASSASRGLATRRRRCSAELTDDFSGDNCLPPQASSGPTYRQTPQSPASRPVPADKQITRTVMPSCAATAMRQTGGVQPISQPPSCLPRLLQPSVFNNALGPFLRLTDPCRELDDNGIRALAADLASQPGFIARVEAMSREDIVFAIAMLLIHIRASAMAAVREIVHYAAMFVRPALLAPNAEMHALVDHTCAWHTRRLCWYLSIDGNLSASLPCLNYYSVRERPLGRIVKLAHCLTTPLSLRLAAVGLKILRMQPGRTTHGSGVPSPSLTAIARPTTSIHRFRPDPEVRGCLFSSDSPRNINARTSAPRTVAIAMPDKILVNLTTKLHPRSTGSLHWRREGDKVLFSIEADSSDVEVELDADGAPHKTTLSLKQKASEELSPPSRQVIVPDSEPEREPLREPVWLRPHANAGIKITVGDHADSRANVNANADDSPTEYSTSDDTDSRLNVDANADDSPTEYSTMRIRLAPFKMLATSGKKCNKRLCGRVHLGVRREVSGYNTLHRNERTQFVQKSQTKAHGEPEARPTPQNMRKVFRKHCQE